MRPHLVLACAALAAGCAAPDNSPAGVPLTGSWGGEHVGLALTEVGGRIEYDCAAGRIEGPLLPDRSGRFAAAGTHTPGQGGPDRIDYVPPSFTARYSGWVTGAAMTLRVEVPQNRTGLGPFTLRHGAPPMLLRCL